MSKKSAKPKSGASAVLSSQLKAIERLMERRDDATAARRLRALIEAHPDQSGPRRLLVEALEGSQGSGAAAIAAFDWAERRPKSLPAQEMLFRYALQFGHVMLADRTAERLRALGVETPGFPVAAAIREDLLRQPDGSSATAEQMLLFDIGKLHLDGHDFAGVVRWLDGVDLTPAKNNRAMSLFHLDRIEDALAAFLALWKEDPDNLFALGWAARLRLYQGDETGARGLTTPLAAATARRLEDAVPQLDALLLLGEDAAALDAFARVERCDWFGIGEPQQQAMLSHLAACAASRLGEAKRARALCKASLERVPNFKPALESRTVIDAAGDALAYPPVFGLGQALPLTWLNRMRDAGNDAFSHLGKVTASNDFLDALYVGGDDGLRGLVAFILQYRAERGDPNAVERLKRFACLPIGTRETRFGLLRPLHDKGLLPYGEPLELWDGERVTQVKLVSTEIRREPEPSNLPKDLEMLLQRSIDRFNERDYEGAEILLTRILEYAPGHRVALGNLAAIHSAQGRPLEAIELLRDVIARFPDYVFPRCNLAVMLIEAGEIDEAARLLDGLYERPSLHVQDIFVLYGALAMLSRARGNQPAADALIASLEPLVEDEDDARRLALAKRLQGRVRPGADKSGRFERKGD
ncbi:tetratricopeptide repeat protein [Thiocapsa rosea]|uniref:Tetratricopeptide repeat protein n=1 Tax=Thiocapsa rosea TaxID=69360 RepID=A0A495VAA4_9GAMM|nr:tetratricopeptide repeat protein [Thiocapsa rosea]RKT46321.1 tetratricopeptide repeat protein [Thiocapsa rosea]